MLTREGAILLIGISGWTILLSSLLYQPFLFLASFFLQTFYAAYIFLAQRRLGKLDSTGFILERTVEPQRTRDQTLLRVKLRARFEGEGWFFIQISDQPPYGTEKVEGNLEIEGIIGGTQTLEGGYTLRVNPPIAFVRFKVAKIRIHDPLRLYYVERNIGVESDIIVPVGEQLVGTVYARLRAAWIRPPMGIGMRSLVGYDDEFSGVKAYELGDKMRDIHWMRYAQQVAEDEIVAKKYVKKGDVALHVVVDCSPSINAGEGAALLTDISTLLRRLCQTTEEEGNTIQFWLLNPALNLNEKISPRRVFSRVLLELYIARIFPVEGRDDGQIAEVFSKTIKGTNIVVFIVNPPSANMDIIEEMMNACRRVGARFFVCVPEVSSYVPPVGEVIERILRMDRMLKYRWLSKAAEGGALVEIRRGYQVDIAREAMKRGGEWAHSY
ncbi:MAG: DUF58 domain-containing protein [Nitrososphaerota archaeon]|nr:DUF58 domain-containing protein [Candidatus Calditenuaceae archaeon]MDW8073081.1 DUF58 domain-containing protein [Nitrososphaerota archaeon]